MEALLPRWGSQGGVNTPHLSPSRSRSAAHRQPAQLTTSGSANLRARARSRGEAANAGEGGDGATRARAPARGSRWQRISGCAGGSASPLRKGAGARRPVRGDGARAPLFRRARRLLNGARTAASPARSKGSGSRACPVARAPPVGRGRRSPRGGGSPPSRSARGPTRLTPPARRGREGARSRRRGWRGGETRGGSAEAGSSDAATVRRRSCSSWSPA